MKNMFKYLAAMAMSVALTGMVACTDPDPEPEPMPDPGVQSTVYAFQYQGRILEAGDTIVFFPTEQQISAGDAVVHFRMVNNTQEDLSTVMEVKKVAGPREYNTLSICFEDCRDYQLPWTSNPFTLVPGVNSDVAIHYDPSQITGTNTMLYRITIGKGTAMEDPQVMFLSMSATAQ